MNDSIRPSPSPSFVIPTHSHTSTPTLFVRFLHGLYIFALLYQSIVAVIEGLCVIEGHVFSR